MELDVPVKINDSLEIELVIQGSVVRFPTRVEDLSQDLIWVDPPMHKLRSFLLPLGQAVRLRCASPLGIHTTRTVVRQVRTAPMQLLGLDAQTPWDRVQQREDVRVDVMLRPLQLQVIPQELVEAWSRPAKKDVPSKEKVEPAERACDEAAAPEDPGSESEQAEDIPQPIPIDGVVMNLSAGGMLVSTEYPLALGTTLFISFDLSPVASRLDLNGRVVRVEQRGNAAKTRAGIQFLGLKSKQQQVLVRYVFQRARELRSKGLM